MDISPPPPGMTNVLFIESGVGTDQHGQCLTKACVRACKDAISFNSIPRLHSLVPGGGDAILIRLELAVPFDGDVPPAVDLERIREVFPPKCDV